MGLVAGSRSLEYLKNHGYWSLITRFLKSGPFMFHPSMEFSWNGGTPKSSMVFGYSPILGNLHLPTYGMAIPTEWAIIQLLFAYLLDLWTTHGLSMPGINHVKQQNIPLNGTKNNQTKRCTITVYMAYLKVSKNGGTPQIIHFMFGFSMKKTIQLLGYPHDYGNPHFPFPSPSIHTWTVLEIPLSFHQKLDGLFFGIPRSWIKL